MCGVWVEEGRVLRRKRGRRGKEWGRKKRKETRRKEAV